MKRTRKNGKLRMNLGERKHGFSTLPFGFFLVDNMQLKESWLNVSIAR